MANNSPRKTSSSTCRTGSQRSPGNFTRQPFTALCRSGTSASTARANTSDIQVLVSVPRPPAHSFLNASHIIDFYKDAKEFKKGYQTRVNMIKRMRNCLQILTPSSTDGKTISITKCVSDSNENC